MNKGTWLLLGGILGGSLLISSVVLIIVNNYKYNRDVKRYEEQKIMAEISSDYELYKDDLNSFSSERTTIVDEITDYLSFYSKIEKNYSKVKKDLDKYEALIGDIEDKYQILNKNCVGKTYYKYDVENKCEAYESSFEQTVNSFVRNLSQYNKAITEYNEWTKEEANKNYKKQNLLVANKYNTYIDLNKDGVYEGKDNTTTEEEKIDVVE